MEALWRICLKHKFFLLVFLLDIIFLSSIVTVEGFSKENKKQSFSELRKHDPIIISSDEQFSLFPGNGTRENPYRIENYSISTPYLSGIYIKGTSVHFVIQNCFINAGQTRSAIYIAFVANGTAVIKNNTIVQSNYGIEILYTDSSVIENNTIENHKNSGIKISSSHFTTISSNHIRKNGGHGILLDVANNSTVYKNVIEDNLGYGIYSVFSYFSNFSSNYLIHDIIFFYEQETEMYNSCFFSNNLINGLPISIHIDTEGKIISGDLGFLMIINCFNLTITNLNITDSDTGIYIYNSEDIIITNSTLKDTHQESIIVSKSENVILDKNIISYSSQTAINIYFSSNIYLCDNLFFRNYYGIEIDDSFNCSIVYNTFEQNINYAILLKSNSSLVLVHHNLFINNNFLGNSQAYDEGQNNIWYDKETKKGNYWSDYEKEGVYSIDGPAHSYDPFPEGKKETTSSPFYLLNILIPLIFLYITNKKLRKRKIRQETLI